MGVEIQIGRSHLVLASLVFLLASASATVEVRDTLQVEGILDMNANRITGLGSPEQPADAANKRYVDSSGSGGFYGYGSDGEKVVSGTETVSGTKYYEGLTVEEGGTLAVDGDRLVVFSTENILVKGKIDAEGAADNGGEGADEGGAGNAYFGGGDGGAGIFSGGGGGAGGGAGGISEWESGKINRLSTFGGPWTSPYEELIYGGIAGGAGGGGGGEGVTKAAGGTFVGRPNGGDGGDGGGVVILVAPRVQVDGGVNADGVDGDNGGTPVDYAYGGSDSSGGGGGGGGGLIVLAGGEVDASDGTLSVEGGVGGLDGGGPHGNGDSGDGEDGSNGRVFVLG